MENKPQDFLKLLGDIVQIGIVVDDIEKAKAGMKQVFGVDPDNESDNLFRKTWCRGEIIDAHVKALFYNQFNVELEFLQPVGEENTIWRDYLNEGYEVRGHAIHHIRFDVDNNDEISEIMAAHGISKYMEGNSIVSPGGKFTYYDAVDVVGFIIEVVTKTKEGVE